ncbi:MAG: GMP synthase [Bacteroidetes bacterium]|nr:GMP synthase [Bacteroidota bacterium]MBS1975756.1 GMP synthase [Bacteroidota bacterium]
MKIAVLDLYEGEANEGMRCIRQLLEEFRSDYDPGLTYDIFDVRSRKEIADLGYDVYISSGGPGSPLTSEGSDWEKSYFQLMDLIRRYNSSHPQDRKYVFLICHSFQIYCRQYGYATIIKRRSTAFGVMPVHKTKQGRLDPLLHGLDDPFYAVDSRDYQILQPREEKIWSGGGEVLCIEKDRPNVGLERAVMAIRFDESIVGTQFHPEADSEGMYNYLIREDKRKSVIERHGAKKYEQMLLYLNEPDKIRRTYHTVIPGFLRSALKHKMKAVVP